MTPTDEELMEALRASATFSTKKGLWTWNPYEKKPFWHTEKSALQITKACLYLNVPVTDIVTGQTWLRVVERLIRLEERTSA